MAGVIYSKGPWFRAGSIGNLYLCIYYIKSEVQTEYFLFPVTYNLKCAYFLV